MSDVFADTYYFIALLSPDDGGHRKAVEATIGRRGKLVTTAWVLSERANTLSNRRNRQTFINTHGALRADPTAIIVAATEELFDLGVDHYSRRPDKDWSLTDCISFVVMERMGLSDALTNDHHFEQAGFNVLLKEQ